MRFAPSLSGCLSTTTASTEQTQKKRARGCARTATANNISPPMKSGIDEQSARTRRPFLAPVVAFAAMAVSMAMPSDTVAVVVATAAASSNSSSSLAPPLDRPARMKFMSLSTNLYFIGDPDGCKGIDAAFQQANDADELKGITLEHDVVDESYLYDLRMDPNVPVNEYGTDNARDNFLKLVHERMQDDEFFGFASGSVTLSSFYAHQLWKNKTRVPMFGLRPYDAEETYDFSVNYYGNTLAEIGYMADYMVNKLHCVDSIFITNPATLYLIDMRYPEVFQPFTRAGLPMPTIISRLTTDLSFNNTLILEAITAQPDACVLVFEPYGYMVQVLAFLAQSGAFDFVNRPLLMPGLSFTGPLYGMEAVLFNSYVTSTTPDFNADTRLARRFRAAIARFDELNISAKYPASVLPGLFPQYTSSQMEGYIVGRMIIETIKSSMANLTREGLLDTVYRNRIISVEDFAVGPFTRECTLGIPYACNCQMGSKTLFMTRFDGAGGVIALQDDASVGDVQLAQRSLSLFECANVLPKPRRAFILVLIRPVISTAAPPSAAPSAADATTDATVDAEYIANYQSYAAALQKTLNVFNKGESGATAGFRLITVDVPMYYTSSSSSTSSSTAAPTADSPITLSTAALDAALAKAVSKYHPFAVVGYPIFKKDGRPIVTASPLLPRTPTEPLSVADSLLRMRIVPEGPSTLPIAFRQEDSSSSPSAASSSLSGSEDVWRREAVFTDPTLAHHIHVLAQQCSTGTITATTTSSSPSATSDAPAATLSSSSCVRPIIIAETTQIANLAMASFETFVVKTGPVYSLSSVTTAADDDGEGNTYATVRAILEGAISPTTSTTTDGSSSSVPVVTVMVAGLSKGMMRGALRAIAANTPSSQPSSANANAPSVVRFLFATYELTTQTAVKSLGNTTAAALLDVISGGTSSTSSTISSTTISIAFPSVHAHWWTVTPQSSAALSPSLLTAIGSSTTLDVSIVKGALVGGLMTSLAQRALLAGDASRAPTVLFSVGSFSEGGVSMGPFMDAKCTSTAAYDALSSSGSNAESWANPLRRCQCNEGPKQFYIHDFASYLSSTVVFPPSPTSSSSSSSPSLASNVVTLSGCGIAYIPYPITPAAAVDNTAKTIGIAVGVTGGLLLFGIGGAVAIILLFFNGGGKSNKNAPKDPNKPFAVAFTDIQSSTNLWVRAPEAMATAVDNHHTLIRSVLEKYKGYEVKTIGDSFMVVFEEVSDAANFAVGIQTALFEFDWPLEIDAVYCALALEKAEETNQPMDPLYEEYMQSLNNVNNNNGSGDDIEAVAAATRYRSMWHGLRVRVGVNYGMGDIRKDEVSKGYDYYGTIINTAARVEGVANGGQILFTKDAYDALHVDFIQKVLNCDVVNMGPQELRGLDAPITLYQFNPRPQFANRVFGKLRLEVENAIENVVAAIGDDGAAGGAGTNTSNSQKNGRRGGGGRGGDASTSRAGGAGGSRSSLASRRSSAASSMFGGNGDGAMLLGGGGVSGGADGAFMAMLESFFEAAVQQNAHHSHHQKTVSPSQMPLVTLSTDTPLMVTPSPTYPNTNTTNANATTLASGTLGVPPEKNNASTAHATPNVTSVSPLHNFNGNDNTNTHITGNDCYFSPSSPTHHNTNQNAAALLTAHQRLAFAYRVLSTALSPCTKSYRHEAVATMMKRWHVARLQLGAGGNNNNKRSANATTTTTSMGPNGTVVTTSVVGAPPPMVPTSRDELFALDIVSLCARVVKVVDTQQIQLQKQQQQQQQNHQHHPHYLSGFNTISHNNNHLGVVGASNDVASLTVLKSVGHTPLSHMATNNGGGGGLIATTASASGGGLGGSTMLAGSTSLPTTPTQPGLSVMQQQQQQQQQHNQQGGGPSSSRPTATIVRVPSNNNPNSHHINMTMPNATYSPTSASLQE